MSERNDSRNEQVLNDIAGANNEIPDRLEQVENTLELILGEEARMESEKGTNGSQDSEQTVANLHRRLDRVETLLSLALGIDVPREAYATAADAERPRYTVYLDDPRNEGFLCGV